MDDDKGLGFTKAGLPKKKLGRPRKGEERPKEPRKYKRDNYAIGVRELARLGYPVDRNLFYDATGKSKRGRRNRRMGRDKKSYEWLVERMKIRKVTVADLSRFMGYAPADMTMLLHDPLTLSGYELILISIRSGIPLRDIYAWVHKANEVDFLSRNKLWFEEDFNFTDPNKL